MPNIEDDYSTMKQDDDNKKNIHQDYWLRKLSGELNRSRFQYDYKETVSNVRLIDSVEFRFSGDIFSNLLHLSEESDLNLYKVLTAGLISLLGKYSYTETGLKDIIIGAPVLFMQRKGIETKPVNSILALRCQFEENITFIDMCIYVGKIIEEANEHKDYPVEKLPRELGMQVFGDDFPLFDVAVSLENIQDKRYIRHLNVNMIFSFFKTGKYIDGLAEFNSSLYERTTIEKIINHFTNLLRSALADHNKDVPLSGLDILSMEERTQLLYEFNDEKMEYPKDKLLHELFEEKVENTPDNIALVFQDKHLSYRAFNNSTNQLAKVLRKKGIVSECIAGIMVDRSIEMLMAIMAVLKAGGAYLPINPSYPAERVRYLLKDSNSRLLLTQDQYLETVEFDREKIKLDDKSLYRGDNQNLEIVNIATDLAYIIYTSGSTGQPKGVMIQHASAVNTLMALYDKYPLEETDTYLLKTSFMFDVSVSEVFGWFWGGGRLSILDPGGEKDPLMMIDKIEEEKITHINFVPSMFNLFVNVLDQQNFSKLSGLKYIFLAGEAIWADSIVKFRKFKSNVVTENIYGPTEATIYASRYPVDQWGGVGSIPIGIPMDNTKLYILGSNDDKHPGLKPRGIPGELAISGIGLARGYLNRPELTSEKFIDNPFAKEEGWNDADRKLYRTGDLSFWMLDGNIEYLGRIDHQVKIRGFRIETGEIENKILTQQKQRIKEVVAIPRDDSVGEKYLCAYLVADEKIDISLLKTTLLESIPDYMVPSYFMQLEKIPLNPNGKVDRKVLPDPTVKRKGENYAAPRNEIEEKLLEIWSHMLHMNKDIISIDDNFFHIGGHSLKAAVMITAIHKTFNVKVLMHKIFDMPTIRKMGQYIKDANQELYSSIQLIEKKEYYPQTSAQKRLYFIDQFEKDSTMYNIQMMDIYCKGLEKEKLNLAVRELIRRHESLRTAFFTIEGEAVQKVYDYKDVGSDFEIEYWETDEEGMISSEAPGKEWTKITGLPFNDVIEQFVKPFDLSKAPILRVGLIKIWGQTQILMVDMHHIMSDGVSEVILIKDLWALYDSGELTGLPVQYKDYAQWVNSEEQKKEIKKQEAFWLKEFEGEIPILNLPYDYPRPARMTFDGDTSYFELNKEETKRLNTLAQEQGVTLYMVLFAVYNVLLAKLSGQEDIAVGTVTAGRGHAELQQIIGMFVDTLAVRNYPDNNKTFNQFLGEVKVRTLAAFENQDYPLEQLVSKVAQRKDTSRNPLFDVVFSLDNEAERTDLYLLNVLMIGPASLFKFDVKKSKFDLILTAIEKEDELEFSLEYNTKIFKVETIEEGFIKYFKNIVYSVCRASEQKISEIEIIPDLERGLLLYSFNDEMEYPKNKTIHLLFEEQVVKNPDNKAVIGLTHGKWGTQITYKKFNSKANQMAALLRTSGIKPDNIAAVMVEPYQEMIIGLMAILKAGGAFLPIDHKIPTDRIQYILEESGTRYLLTREELLEEIEFNGEIIQLDNHNVYSGNNTNPRDVNKSRDLAYVIYTSGSTGKPKGVMVSHRSLANLCSWHNKYYSVSSEDHATKFAGFGFDASVWEVFPYLIIGAALYIVPVEIKLDIHALNRYFEENRITISFLPTQLCEQFMTIENNSLRALLTGGDKLKTFVKKKYQLYNNYGPTENTVVTTSFTVTEFSSNIPIGKPVDNNQIYIMDRNDKLQPIGVPGELCIGGDSLARGYLNNPELTDEKFIESPFKHLTPWTQYPKVYRTGDLARWLPVKHKDWLIEGKIEFLGRIDYQVKIRGFRIELGEIENQLLHIENLKEAVVIAREDASGQKYLCAYIVSGGIMDTSDIKERLAKNLPDYMVPSYFVQIEKMPLNPSGKIDTKALPAPEVKSIEYAAPTNEIEKIMTQTWAEVLGQEKIGIDDNFFKMGGDSIKTILISARLRKYNLDVHVNDFFIYPTIRELAKNLSTLEPMRVEETVNRDEHLIAMDIEKDFQKYLERIQHEKWANLTAVNKYNNILLTGATGYLGAHLTHELLNTTTATLYLPVRGASQKEAEFRLNERISFYFGRNFIDKIKHRIVILKSDLKEDHLGINESQYEKLCSSVDAVLHSAANVKHYGLYEEFYIDNVQATEQLLKFALTNKKKDFHFISTLDTGRGDIPDKDYLLYTEYCLDEGQESHNVYIKSKHEAEKRVLAYRKKGLNASIYRASNMTFHSQTGLFQQNIHENFFYSMLKALIKVGFWSDKMLKITVDLSFVNEAAKAITLLLTRKYLKNQTYHICNPHMISWIEMAELLKQAGVKLPDLDPETVKIKLSTYAGNSEYEKIIERVKIYSWEWEGKEKTVTIPKIDRTVLLLKKLGFEWPIITKHHIEKMIAHCKDVGFL
jgi:amino acid adenylation domain-containing protein/thioester reductase-like protein